MLLNVNFKTLFAMIALCLIVIEARPRPQEPDAFPEVIIEEDIIDDSLPYDTNGQVDPDSFPLAPDVPGVDDYHIRK